jgi:hypothetical protein
MSLAEELLKIPVASEEVTVLGNVFVVTGKSLGDKAALLASCRKKDGSLNGDLFDQTLLTECVTMKEDGSTLTKEQWSKVGSHITSPLLASVISLLGFDEDDIQRVRRDPKGSDSTQS